MPGKTKADRVSGEANVHLTGFFHQHLRITILLISLITMIVIYSQQPKSESFVAPDMEKSEQGMDRLLSNMVDKKGKVNYRVIRENPFALNAFLDFIHSISPDNRPDLFPTANDRKAYWINAYNALVMKVVVENPSAKSLPDMSWGYGIFWRKKFKVGNQFLTLNDIENKKLRAAFHDPRIHFAINCGSESCPPIGRRIFTGDSLEVQLDEKTQAFVNDTHQVRIDSVSQTLWLSKIFKWYRKDFEASSGSVLDFLDQYSNQVDLEKTPELRNWKIKYFDYNWSLNEHQ